MPIPHVGLLRRSNLSFSIAVIATRRAEMSPASVVLAKRCRSLESTKIGTNNDERAGENDGNDIASFSSHLQLWTS